MRAPIDCRLLATSSRPCDQCSLAVQSPPQCHAIATRVRHRTQTTIEFYSNKMDASDARRRGERWYNPFSVGARKNFEQVFGMSRCASLAARSVRSLAPHEALLWSLLSCFSLWCASLVLS